MKTRRMLGLIFIALAMISTGCEFEVRDETNVETAGADTVAVDRDTTYGMMMHDPQMMRTMMQDSTARRSMMQTMMQDTAAMRMMMTDSSMARMMSQHMASHPDLMRRHMQTMLNNPQHRAAMLQVVRQDSTVRGHLRDILADAGATE